jgi:hypothetical protein
MSLVGEMLIKAIVLARLRMRRELYKAGTARCAVPAIHVAPPLRIARGAACSRDFSEQGSEGGMSKFRLLCLQLKPQISAIQRGLFHQSSISR